MSISMYNMTQKQYSDLYTKLYNKASKIIGTDKPCRTCLEPDKSGYCCFRCAHLSSTGCTVKALYCKVWLCTSARLAFPKTSYKLDGIMRRANKYLLLKIRASKKETLSQVYRIMALTKK